MGLQAQYTNALLKIASRSPSRDSTLNIHSAWRSLRQLETVGSLKHRNLVCLQGYSLSPSGNLLFNDYMENGSLWDLLHGPAKTKKLDWDTRLKIALGAAEGLLYLTMIVVCISSTGTWNRQIFYLIRNLRRISLILGLQRACAQWSPILLHT